MRRDIVVNIYFYIWQHIVLGNVMKVKNQAQGVKVISYKDVEDKVIELRGSKVILDSHVAELYQVETKRINEAVSRNQDKFPTGYLLELTQEEWEKLKSQFATSIKGGKVKLPIGFTERGLYMLATILKSPIATQTTLLIIDAFSKLREMKHIVSELQHVKPDSPQQKSLMQQAGNIISELIVSDENEAHEAEASIELNLALVKFKYSVKKSRKMLNKNKL